MTSIQKKVSAYDQQKVCDKKDNTSVQADRQEKKTEKSYAGDQKTDEAAFQDKLGMKAYAAQDDKKTETAKDEEKQETAKYQSTEAKETKESEDAQNDEGAGQAKETKNGKGANKDGCRIPPGLAKKNAADLPDGNPWKSVLAAREEAEAEKTKDGDQQYQAAGGSGIESLLAQLQALIAQFIQRLQAEEKGQETAEKAQPPAESAEKTAAKPTDSAKTTTNTTVDATHAMPNADAATIRATMTAAEPVVSKSAPAGIETPIGAAPVLSGRA